MNIHHLELFYFIATHGGITEAARKMPYGIQQPAISAQILRLEEDLGVKLFQRRPFQLTPAGRELYEFAAPFFSLVQETSERPPRVGRRRAGLADQYRSGLAGIGCSLCGGGVWRCPQRLAAGRPSTDANTSVAFARISEAGGSSSVDGQITADCGIIFGIVAVGSTRAARFLARCCYRYSVNPGRERTFNPASVIPRINIVMLHLQHPNVNWILYLVAALLKAYCVNANCGALRRQESAAKFFRAPTFFPRANETIRYRSRDSGSVAILR